MCSYSKQRESVMKRLIDDKDATRLSLQEFIWSMGNVCMGVDKWIEEIYAPIAEWHDNLDPDNSDTWVLCFVSDSSSTDTSYAEWIIEYKTGPYPFTCADSECTFRYATPVDLSIRFSGKL